MLVAVRMFRHLKSSHALLQAMALAVGKSDCDCPAAVEQTSEAPDPSIGDTDAPSSAVAAADITATPMIAVVSATFGTVASTVSVLPWGENSFRIRKGAAIYNGPGALESQAPTSTGATGYWEEGQVQSWRNGNLIVSLDASESKITASRPNEDTPFATLSLGVTPGVDDGTCGSAQAADCCCSFGTCTKVCSTDEVKNMSTLSVESSGAKGTFSYLGFGEHENGKLDQLGLRYEMEECIEYSHSRGGEVCLPWIMVASDSGAGKSFQFGLLWNVPAYGSAAFGVSEPAVHTWTAYNIDQHDFVLTTYGADASKTGRARAAALLSHYVDAVGHAPPLPAWASGYWHSKNRYASQAEVASALAQFKNYSISMSVFVIDYFNWAVMGNLEFDPKKWPRPKEMTAALKAFGTKTMVSTWPFAQGASPTYGELQANGYAVFEGTNASASVDWPDGVCGKPCYLYDASNPAAREFWFGKVQKGYVDNGVELFWLDAAEPEQQDGSPAGSAWSVGSMQRVGMMFPYYHTQTYAEGFRRAGLDDSLVLARSAWAGAQKHRVVLWNGDTQSTFDYLRTALAAMMSVQMSGIAWWTTDIGGYAGGDPADATFRELIVRWFQFGATCPIFRQHGARDTEPWLLGDTSFAAVRKVMALRESLRTYVVAELSETAASGLPYNRPLFFDYPNDADAWAVDDQYMVGRQYMAAPLYAFGARNRTVYFPVGASWTHHFTGKTYSGGTHAVVDAPLDEFPLFEISAVELEA